MPRKPLGSFPRSNMDNLQVDTGNRFVWWYYRTFCLFCKILLGSSNAQGKPDSTGMFFSPLVLSPCSCTALEQLQLEAGINLLLTQPISNKKITAALLGQSNCPSRLIPYKERGFKKLIGGVASYKVSGEGEHVQLNFIGFKPFTCRWNVFLLSVMFCSRFRTLLQLNWQINTSEGYFFSLVKVIFCLLVDRALGKCLH